MTEPMTITSGVLQFPQNRCICSLCYFHCFIEERVGKIVASHPTHPSCPNSHKCYEVPMTRCEELPAEFFSEQIE